MHSHLGWVACMHVIAQALQVPAGSRAQGTDPARVEGQNGISQENDWCFFKSLISKEPLLQNDTAHEVCFNNQGGRSGSSDGLKYRRNKIGERLLITETG